METFKLILAFLTGLIPLVLKIWNEVSEDKKKAAEEQKAYELTVQKFNEMADKALAKMRQGLQQDNTNSMEDAMDNEMKKT